MSPIRLLLPGLLMVGGLLSSTAAFAWQSPSTGVTLGFQENATLNSDDDEFVLQDKAVPKPSEPAKPPARPQTPPAPPSRPAPRPGTPPAPATPQPQPPQPQFNPFVNPQPNQPYLARLSRAPDMFGDSFLPLSVTLQVDGEKGVLDLPLAGGSRRFKNEHSRALPTDRVFGTYHHFQNAIEARALEPGFVQSNANIDRFTVGFEKTFFDGNASVELRMPMSVPASLSGSGFNYQTESAGDLVVVLRGLLYSDESQAVGLGLTINAPTGSDLTVNLPNVGGNFTVENDATHLTPFLAYQAAPTENFFFNSFLQVDFATNANSLQLRNIGNGGIENRSLTDQTLLFLDTSFGYWLFRDPDAEFLTGLAGLLELHYTTALTDADVVSSANQQVVFGANSGSLDAINLTIGLHTEINRSTVIRAGYVTPLRDGNHRFFDSEFTVAVIFKR